jgi:NAD(P)-dependent dehydrogenase (short-subunit alcohol dehydrogenase family)
MAASVVVTGATGGIGRATALLLARAGYDVVGTARSEEAARELRKGAAGCGPGVRTVVCDVADPVATARAFAEIAGMTGGGPWAVVNNAGFAQAGAVEDLDDESARRQLEVNLLAPVRIARLVLPAMRRRRDGRIVNVSSVVGRMTVPMLGWYCASKQGLAAVSDALRMEVSPAGVEVVMVEPGPRGTPIGGRTVEGLPGRRHPYYRAAYRRVEALMRRAWVLPGPEPVAAAVLRALRSPRPPARILVGPDAHAAALLEAVAPTAVADWVKSAAVGLRWAGPR